MIEYFVTRKRWRRITENRINRQKIHDRKYWSKWFAQKIILEKEIVKIDKGNDIKLLEDDNKKIKQELKDYKREILNYDLSVEKTKNELVEKIKILDSKIKQWGEVSRVIQSQIGISESLNRDSEKLLNKG